MELTRTFDILNLYEHQYKGKADALAGKIGGKWVKYSSEDYLNYSEWLSIGLLSIGIAKGDRVVTISNNRPEWNFLDMALAQIGAIHVPLFTTLEEQGYLTIINACQAKMVFVSDEVLAGQQYLWC